MAINPKRRTRVLLILGGAAAALAVFIVVFVYVSERNNTPEQTVVVAKSDLQAGAALSSDNLVTSQVPSTNVPGGTFSDPSQLSGKFIVIAATANTVITNGMVTSSANSITAVPSGGFNLKAGDVAMAIPYADATGGGGYIRPGDHIDILVDTTGQDTVRYGFEDVPVLKVGSATQQTGAAPTLLMVELPRSQAEIMGVFLGAGGNAKGVAPSAARYVIRPQSEWGKGHLTVTPYAPPNDDTPIGPDQLQQLFQGR